MTEEVTNTKRSVHVSWFFGLPCLVYEDETLVEIENLEANRELLLEGFKAMWNK
jgi:hypothetical protein